MSPLKSAPSRRVILTTSNTWLLGPTWVSPPKRHVDRFRRSYTAHPCVQHTDRHTDLVTCDICRNRPHLCTACMRCGLKSRHSKVAPNTLAIFSSNDRELSPVTLTFELGLDNVKVNEDAKYLGQRSLSSIAIVRTHWKTQTHTPDWQLYLDHWSGWLKC